MLALCMFAQDCSRKPIYRANLKDSVCEPTSNNTCDWMTELLRSHPAQDIALTDICLPASHDAGMYLTQYCTAFGNSGNTQTQYLPMKQQLEAGLRLFDVRPAYYRDDFYTWHETKCDGLGCHGDKLKNMLNATKIFLDTHSELVILELSHFCHTSATDSAFLSLLANTFGDYIYRESIPSDIPIIKRPLRQILPAGSKTGKVLLLLEDAPNTREYRAKGFFNTNEKHDVGGWTNDNMYLQLREHQLRNFSRYSGNGSTLYTLAWQITQHDEQALRSALAPHARVALYKGSYKANLQLPGFLDSLISTHDIHKGKIPNIVWSDFADTAVVHQCMKLTRISVD